MQLDAKRLYRAVESRDKRFEGAFVLGVVTTGVYCRPGCPARLPKPENVRFFATPAAAEHDGFRACLRCRPDASPRTPSWVGTAATVARALRLIDAGELDGTRVDDLASRLGVGERHLRRLFAEHVGTSPIVVARSRRLHFGRKLIDETNLSMTEVAAAAGFSSTRRFNDEMRKCFGRPPSALRRKKSSARESGAWIHLSLPFRPPYDFQALLDFLALRAVPMVERVDGAAYRRSVRVRDTIGVIEVRCMAEKPALDLRVSASLTANLYRVADRVSRLFDLRADPEAVRVALSGDPLVGPLHAAMPGLRVPGAWDGFEIVVRAVLGQQVTVKGATTLATRLVRAFGEPIETSIEPELTHLFPTPEALDRGDLASIGLPLARAETLRQVARAALRGELSFESDGLSAGAERLTSIAGIGPWTAAYVAMRAASEPDAFPASDLVLRKAFATGGKLASAAEVTRRAESLRPFRAYAALTLWTNASRKPS